MHDVVFSAHDNHTRSALSESLFSRKGHEGFKEVNSTRARCHSGLASILFLSHTALYVICALKVDWLIAFCTISE